jgi:hypothetical protein
MAFSFWSKYLKGDEDEDLLTEIFAPGQGLRLINPEDQVSETELANYRMPNTSVYEAFTADIREELRRGYIAVAPRKPRKVNALGAVDKGDGRYRRITDLSRPVGGALNDLVAAPAFKFESVDDACKIAVDNGHIFSSKYDLVSAYRHLPVWPDHWDLCGFLWDGVYYVDLRLCFGYRRAPYVFYKVSNFIKRIGQKYYSVCLIVPYLDDFLILSPGATKEEAYKNACHDAANFRRCLQEMGWEISEKKSVGPTQLVVFLGIQLDLVAKTISLPQDKLNKLMLQLEEFNTRTTAKKRRLQKLAGCLNFACSVIKGGRTFLRRVIDLISSISEDARHIPVELTDDFKLDIRWWLKFARQWNGKEKMLDSRAIDEHRFTVDASNRAACAVFDNHFIVRVHDDMTKSWHINEKECLAVYLAALKWGHRWANKRIIVKSDNQTTVTAINKGSSSATHIMRMLRSLFWLSAKFNFHLIAEHIQGKLNVLADAGSRENYEVLDKAGITMSSCPTLEWIDL